MQYFEQNNNISAAEHEDLLRYLVEQSSATYQIPGTAFDNPLVKRGLREHDGSGVVAGVSRICNAHGYVMNEGEKSPVPGRVIYSGIDNYDLVEGCQKEDRFGFEETVWLLLFGKLPNKAQLEGFQSLLSSYRDLPEYFAKILEILRREQL